MEDRSDLLVVSAAFLAPAFGGAAAFYSLRLGRPSASAVVVHLVLPPAPGDAGCGLRLSSDRLFFAPERFSEPQLVRVDCADDRAATVAIAHKVYSLDRSFDHALAPDVVVKTARSGGRGGSLLSFGAQMTKRQAAALGGAQVPTRLDLLTPALGGAAPSPSMAGEGSPTNSSSSSSLAGLTNAPTTAEPPWYINHLASGHHFSLVVVSLPQTDALLSWGANANGELGNGATAAVSEPQPVLTAPMQRLLPGECLRIAQVACGKHHAAVVTRSAHLFTWGNNKYGQLGHGDFATRLVPQEVNLTLASLTVSSSARRALRVKHAVKRGGTNVTHVCCGSYHTLFVTHQQQILGMGYNQAGQLGIGHRLQQYKSWRSCTPIAVEGLRDCSILDLAAGQNHSACVLNNGDVYVWGCGDDGRLGTGDRDSMSSPTLLLTLRNAKVRARTIRCGARHTAVISDRDLLYVWGANEFGQLGCGDRRTRLKPALVAFPPLLSHGVADVSLGEFHSACITFTGVAYTWGLDLAAESTDIEQRNTPQPIQLPGHQAERVKRVSCGWAHTNLSTQLVGNEESSGSSNNQPTSFHRKLEREKMQVRRDEVARWRAFVSPGGVSTWQQQARLLRHVKGRVSLAMEPGGKFDRPLKVPVSVIRENDRSPRQNKIALPRRDAQDIVELKSVVRGYCNAAIQDAIKHVGRLLVARAHRRILTSSEMPGHGEVQLQGIFNAIAMQPPAFPEVALDSSAPMRSLPCYTIEIRQPTAIRNIRPSKPASTSRPTSAAPTTTSRSSRLSGIIGQYDRGDLAQLLSDASSEFDCTIQSTRPQTARSATPRSMGSPRRQQLAVMDSLLHQPSFSITTAVLTPSTPRR